MSSSPSWLACPECDYDKAVPSTDVDEDDDPIWYDDQRTCCSGCGVKLRVKADGDYAWVVLDSD